MLERNACSLMSMPTPIFVILPFFGSLDTNKLISVTGRLSTQKKLLSSSALNATVFPEPERPVIITIVGFNFYTGCRIHDA
jgi:hypothetical protein